MSKIHFFMRFTITYAVVMAAAGLTVGVLGIENTTSIETSILFGTSYWCIYSYMNKNKKIVDGNEKWSLILLLILGDVITSIALAIPTMIADEISIKFLFIGMAIIIPLHGLLFVAVNYGVKKQMIKQQPELAQN